MITILQSNKLLFFIEGGGGEGKRGTGSLEGVVRFYKFAKRIFMANI